MCLALPVRLHRIETGTGWAELGGGTMRLSLALTPGATVGDWVLVHAGFAIQVLSEADAYRTWADLERCAEGLPAPPLPSIGGTP